MVFSYLSYFIIVRRPHPHFTESRFKVNKNQTKQFMVLVINALVSNCPDVKKTSSFVLLCKFENNQAISKKTCKDVGTCQCDVSISAYKTV